MRSIKGTIAELGEDGMVRRIERRCGCAHPRLIKGIGDDASVTVQRPGLALLATTDTLVEGVHFDLNYTPARLLGRKALNISLSDIAAMGGVPLFYLVSVALPPTIKKIFLDDLYKGLSDGATAAGVFLAGGNTVRTDAAVMISTTVIGEAKARAVVYRHTARPGDIIYVTGTLGDAALGLKTLAISGFKKASRGAYKNAVKRHLDPAARLDAGRLLAERGLTGAMMDVSDGLLLDLSRICKSSAVSAVVEAERTPFSKELSAYAADFGTREALTLALTGGEDYELLFTSRPQNAQRIKNLSKKLRVSMTPVGVIGPDRKGKKVKVVDKQGDELCFKKRGFEHF